MFKRQTLDDFLIETAKFLMIEAGKARAEERGFPGSFEYRVITQTSRNLEWDYIKITFQLLEKDCALNKYRPVLRTSAVYLDYCTN